MAFCMHMEKVHLRCTATYGRSMRASGLVAVQVDSSGR